MAAARTHSGNYVLPVLASAELHFTLKSGQTSNSHSLRHINTMKHVHGVIYIYLFGKYSNILTSIWVCILNELLLELAF